MITQFKPDQAFQIESGSHVGEWTVRTATYDSLLKQTTVYVNESVLTGTDAAQEVISTRQIIPNELLFLLAISPFQTTDRLLDTMIDASNITDTNTTNLTFIKSGNLFMANEAKETVYPLIRGIA